MNVMAQAHKQVRELLAVRPNIAYRVAFVLALINAHKEYKAMQKEQAVAMFTADTIAKFEARIAELQAIKETPVANKWIVTCGGLPVDFEAVNQSWPWADAEKASKWNSPQFARAYAQKIRNGSGEYGVAANVGEYCKAEIAKLKQMILDLKTA